MAEYGRQAEFGDDDAEYAAFVAKFVPKKTTDDCHTPEAVYEAIARWAARRYFGGEIAADAGGGLTIEVSGNRRIPVVRPFWPGADYERAEYPDGCVVIDNPPFSILSKITKFYAARKIGYFLFAPALTLFSNAAAVAAGACFVVVGAEVVYENGAKVRTSFVTNLDAENRFEVRGDLYAAIEATQGGGKPHLPKYEYPDCVAVAARLMKYAKAGCVASVGKREAAFVKRLDAQDKVKQSGIFGGGFFISEAAAAKLRPPSGGESGEVVVWELSERERRIVDLLSAAR